MTRESGDIHKVAGENKAVDDSLGSDRIGYGPRLCAWCRVSRGKCVMNLFAASEQKNRENAKPLAARMRPVTLAEFSGQQHILGEGKLLRRMLDADRIGSMVFYGPPGTGKTTLAELIARQTRRHFERLNATTAGVREVREVLKSAADRLAADGVQTVLFIDELHRFSRSQQDILLPDVENGTISLIGATTANPFFSLVAPLISRSQVFEFRELTKEDLVSGAGDGRGAGVSGDVVRWGWSAGPDGSGDCGAVRVADNEAGGSWCGGRIAAAAGGAFRSGR